MDPHLPLHYPDDDHRRRCRHHHPNDYHQQQQQQLSLVNATPQYAPQQQPYQHSSESSNPLQQHLRSFWDTQYQESKQAADFKNHSLPLARIKKIMKSDDNVRMIAADAPVMLSRACEMFIQDITLRSWNCTEESKRKTLQKADISAALSTSDLFDFLVDILPREKPFISTMMPSMNPSSSLGIVSDQQHFQQHDGNNNYCVGEGAGLNMGLQMHQFVKDDQVNQGGFSGNNSKLIHGDWPNYLSNHPVWPPPDL